MTEIIGGILAAVIIYVLLAIVMAIPTMYLWDWLMPVLFNLPKITLLQAIGINLLCAILFKSNSSSSKS